MAEPTDTTGSPSGRPRRVCVILVDRANYGRLKPVMEAIRDQPGLELQVICSGTMVLERFDQPVRVVERDGFRVDSQIHVELEGSTPVTMAKSVGFGVIEFASELQRLAPDLLLVIGDRYEALSATLAAAYMNLCIVHVQGGEVSGSIDESARHAITKLAHFHYPSTARAREYLLRMGEHPRSILGVGCPSSDLARRLDRSLDPAIVNGRGSGATLDVDEPFLLVLFHPTTTEFGGEKRQMEEVLAALDQVRRPTLLLWPNIDAGADHISKAIREFRDLADASFMRTLTNLTPENYLKVLARAACAVGNSSSFVRDAGFLGTPVVLVGNRQRGREADVHVTRVSPHRHEIAAAIEAQLAHGPYAPSTLYGDGHVSERLARGLLDLEPYVQKHLSYLEEP
ncbi:MAG: UDP-N-acetylglucosamine 2-epimerase (hydrolyzing) [Acidobacteria bacterium]|nr:UDP-N-acetylglucosamine 2-epimerase (hydrolyzing) [Acidobacteriota bacterium]